ncbi:MAG: MaoC family dehydratase [Candidatus Obscuribacterales bacterium]|nr:MaoC family dehydratase [Candidatus Obscuribacterales bacterium]
MVDIKRGTSATYVQTVTDSDIVQFAQSTGDNNPVHLDEDYAKTTPFGKRIAHGMLSAGFISTALGTKLPGPGTIYLRQIVEFRRPVFINDTITATVTVTRLNRKTKRVWLTTVCTNQNGKVVVLGKALVLFNALS